MSLDKFRLDFIGVGTPRSGTTWLSECLAEHPQICFSSPREAHFFDKTYNRRRGLSFYETFFPPCHDACLRGEFTPTYYLQERIAEDISSLFPNVRILLCLRNPVERAFSHYLYNKKRVGQKKSLAQIIEEGKSHIIADGFYFRHLHAFLRHFQRTRVKILSYRDMVESPERSMKEIFGFLGVDDSFSPPSLRRRVRTTANANYRFRSINRLLRLRKRIRQHPWGDALLLSLKRIGAHRMFDALARMNQSRKRPTREETLNDVDRTALQELYGDDIHQLEQWLGRTLD